MKNRPWLLLTFLFALFPFLGDASADEAALPRITSVHRKTVVIDVPPGFESVTLQQRDRKESKTWKILATRKTSEQGGTVRITLKRTVTRRGLFVFGKRVEAVEKVIAPLTTFLADPALQSSNGLTGAGGATSGVVAMSRAATDTALSTNTTTTAAAREVSESDIWRVEGDRLYFFNQLRGLQVFDIADPNAPVLLGQLREPNRGEQMYLLDSDHVALLTRASYYFSLANRPFSLAADASVPYDAASGALVIAGVGAGKPTQLARLSYPGYFVESRLVGSILYIVSQINDPAGESGVLVSSFDLSDPANPRPAAVLALEGYGEVVSATDRYLFVVRSSDDWRRSVVEVIDISAPDGSLLQAGRIAVAGQIPDKFKLNLSGDILTVVSAVPRNWSGNWNAPANQPRTMVETFSLVRPEAPEKLGSLELGVGETVHATRFSGDRLYVVTFLTIDPLWVVDLSNPANPTLLGELEVPGFSTYIEPIGDRLVGIGRVDSRTAVSLFDISDPSSPTLLSQLPLGEGSYSYSEANWDEKAFSVFPEHGLILVPYSGYDSASGWASRIQLVDLGRDALTKRGIVNQGFAARRTAVVDDRILAISASDLITVDFADRDHPTVTSDVEIAWRVDRVFLAGEHLVQIGGSADWSRTTPPTITITPSTDPDTTLNLIELLNVPVTGATVRGDKLYLTQQSSNQVLTIYKTTNAAAPQPLTNPLILSVYDLSSLPDIETIGYTEIDVDPGYGYGAGQLEPVWPNDDTLVWVREAWSSWWWYDTPVLMSANTDSLVAARASVSLAPSGTVALANSNLDAPGTTATNRAANAAVAASSLVADIRIIAPWYRTSVGHEMIVFDVSDPAAPRHAATVDARIGNTGDWSSPVVADGKLYLSYLAYDGGYPNGRRLSRNYRHFLKTVDFSDVENPVVSDEVNIPGRLLDVTDDGTILLTLGCGFDSFGKPKSNQAFHTSRFDGVQTTLVDQLSTRSAYDPYAIGDGTLFVGRWMSTKTKDAGIASWRIDGEAKFKRLGFLPSETFSSFGMLKGLLVGFGDGLPQVFDVTSPADPIHFEGLDTRELGYGDLGKADGGAGLGIWQAQGNSGVGVVKLPR